MKTIPLFLFSVFIPACMNTPDVSSSKVEKVKIHIKENKNEATKAQEAYIRLQRQRNNA